MNGVTFVFGESTIPLKQNNYTNIISNKKQIFGCFFLLRSRSRSPRRRAHTPERRREERSVPTAYRISNSPGNSRKRARSK